MSGFGLITLATALFILQVLNTPPLVTVLPLRKTSLHLEVFFVKYLFNLRCISVVITK